MATLEKRIAALERVDPSAIGQMFIHFVGIGETDKEIQAIKGCGGSWERLPGETEQALKERAMQEAKPNPKGAQVFLCT